MKTSRTLLAILIALLPLLYLNFIWAELPERVATHFNLAGTPDRYSTRYGLYGLLFGLAGFSIALFWGLKNAWKLDPKGGEANRDILEKAALGATLLISFVSLLIIESSRRDNGDLIDYLFVAIPLLFVYLGNLMIHSTPNALIGFRIPATLNDPKVWEETHRVGGRLMMFAGLLCILPMLYLPSWGKMTLLVAMVLVTTIYTVIYATRRGRK
ncbi:SdpI family protein [Siphonobacter aquaeclarae]|uniref:Uncharacterized membrane protein n=1 Tax=Siphonobacter aquaeclarae TaxID=563176 RepID=A0A1G9S384_9BACT|nr:SdpI family protein [Siphonobacter aquaeclarae]SDM30038.1 Uncharacterized membrane protein [Siphonobacter aquaeclarae]